MCNRNKETMHKNFEMCEWWIFTKPYFIWSFSTNINDWDLFFQVTWGITTSSQNSSSNQTLLIIILSLSINVLFILFATPFCWGVYGVVIQSIIPCYLKNYSNFLWKNSPPLLDINNFIFLSIQFSTRYLNSLNLLKTSNFFIKK